MFKINYISIVLLLLVSAVHAETVSVSSFGDRECQSYLNDKKKDSIGYLAANSWITGYVSGMNYFIATNDGVDIIADLDGDIIFDWTAQFCTNKPNLKTSDAIQELFVKLLKLKSKSKSRK